MGSNLWMPISGAPRDGMVVDLWHKSGFRITDQWWTEDDCWTCLFSDSEFTHFMPITTPYGEMVLAEEVEQKIEHDNN